MRVVIHRREASGQGEEIVQQGDPIRRQDGFGMELHPRSDGPDEPRPYSIRPSIGQWGPMDHRKPIPSAGSGCDSVLPSKGWGIPANRDDRPLEKWFLLLRVPVQENVRRVPKSRSGYTDDPGTRPG